MRASGRHSMDLRFCYDSFAERQICRAEALGMSDIAQTAGLLIALQRHDARAFGFMVERRYRRLDPVVRALTRLGDAPVVVLGVAGLLSSSDAELHASGVLALVAVASSHLLVQLLKRTISRPRPRLPIGVAALIQPPDRFSFPSGHAAAALSLALAIAPAAGVLGVAILAVGFAVGISRCYLGVHYPGDVLAGWLVATAGFLLGVAL
jgi:undecaprenyl-diphosphatase